MNQKKIYVISYELQAVFGITSWIDRKITDKKTGDIVFSNTIIRVKNHELLKKIFGE